MGVRKAQKGDYEKLAGLYGAFFSEHNIFRKTPEAVVEYLEKLTLRDLIYVFEENDMIKGGLVLVNKSNTLDNTHKLWQIKHFAFETETIGSGLLMHVENMMKDSSETAKVVVNYAENEEGLDFYKKSGFEVESEIKNYYRWGEKIMILTKTYSK